MVTEEKRRRNREYYLKNREKVKQRSRDWHKKNRKRFLERKRKYNAAHAVERNEKQKAYYWEHRDEKRAYDREYYLKHGDEIRQATLRNARKTVEELEALLKKIFVMKCFFCGKTDKIPRLGVNFHEKNGKEHTYRPIARLRYYLNHPDDFVPVCRHHHILAHRLMMEGFSWKEIVELIVKKREEVGPEKLAELWEDYLARHS